MAIPSPPTGVPKGRVKAVIDFVLELKNKPFFESELNSVTKAKVVNIMLNYEKMGAHKALEEFRALERSARNIDEIFDKAITKFHAIRYGFQTAGQAIGFVTQSTVGLDNHLENLNRHFVPLNNSFREMTTLAVNMRNAVGQGVSTESMIAMQGQLARYMSVEEKNRLVTGTDTRANSRLTELAKGSEAIGRVLGGEIGSDTQGLAMASEMMIKFNTQLGTTDANAEKFGKALGNIQKNSALTAGELIKNNDQILNQAKALGKTGVEAEKYVVQMNELAAAASKVGLSFEQVSGLDLSKSRLGDFDTKHQKMLDNMTMGLNAFERNPAVIAQRMQETAKSIYAQFDIHSEADLVKQRKVNPDIDYRVASAASRYTALSNIPEGSFNKFAFGANGMKIEDHLKQIMESTETSGTVKQNFDSVLRNWEDVNNKIIAETAKEFGNLSNQLNKTITWLDKFVNFLSSKSGGTSGLGGLLAIGGGAGFVGAGSSLMADGVKTAISVYVIEAIRGLRTAAAANGAAAGTGLFGKLGIKGGVATIIGTVIAGYGIKHYIDSVKEQEAGATPQQQFLPPPATSIPSANPANSIPPPATSIPSASDLNNKIITETAKSFNYLNPTNNGNSPTSPPANSIPSAIPQQQTTENSLTKEVAVASILAATLTQEAKKYLPSFLGGTQGPLSTIAHYGQRAYAGYGLATDILDTAQKNWKSNESTPDYNREILDTEKGHSMGGDALAMLFSGKKTDAERRESGWYTTGRELGNLSNYALSGGIPGLLARGLFRGGERASAYYDSMRTVEAEEANLNNKNKKNATTENLSLSYKQSVDRFQNTNVNDTVEYKYAQQEMLKAQLALQQNLKNFDKIPETLAKLKNAGVSKKDIEEITEKSRINVEQGTRKGIFDGLKDFLANPVSSIDHGVGSFLEGKLEQDKKAWNKAWNGAEKVGDWFGVRDAKKPSGVPRKEDIIANNEKIDQLIKKTAKNWNIDEQIVRAVVNKESKGDPNAKNPDSGALGLTQITDSTYKLLLDKKRNPNAPVITDRTNPQENLDAFGYLFTNARSNYTNPKVLHNIEETFQKYLKGRSLTPDTAALLDHHDGNPVLTGKKLIHNEAETADWIDTLIIPYLDKIHGKFENKQNIKPEVTAPAPPPAATPVTTPATPAVTPEAAPAGGDPRTMPHTTGASLDNPRFLEIQEEQTRHLASLVTYKQQSLQNSNFAPLRTDASAFSMG